MTDQPDPEQAIIDRLNADMVQLLQDIETLCAQGEFKSDIFVDFIGQGNKRQFMQYHRDYHQKLAPKRQ